jgi:hypothetical protein
LASHGFFIDGFSQDGMMFVITMPSIDDKAGAQPTRLEIASKDLGRTP